MLENLFLFKLNSNKVDHTDLQHQRTLTKTQRAWAHPERLWARALKPRRWACRCDGRILPGRRTSPPLCCWWVLSARSHRKHKNRSDWGTQIRYFYHIHLSYIRLRWTKKTKFSLFWVLSAFKIYSLPLFWPFTLPGPHLSINISCHTGLTMTLYCKQTRQIFFYATHKQKTQQLISGKKNSKSNDILWCHLSFTLYFSPWTCHRQDPPGPRREEESDKLHIPLVLYLGV